MFEYIDGRQIRPTLAERSYMYGTYLRKEFDFPNVHGRMNILSP